MKVISRPFNVFNVANAYVVVHTHKKSLYREKQRYST